MPTTSNVAGDDVGIGSEGAISNGPRSQRLEQPSTIVCYAPKVLAIWQNSQDRPGDAARRCTSRAISWAWGGGNYARVYIAGQAVKLVDHQHGRQGELSEVPERIGIPSLAIVSTGQLNCPQLL
jgi:hypothetical protein